MRYYIIAGEASGDLHASNLMKAFKEQDAQADFRYWGGDLMKEQGGTLVRHYKDTAVMGLWDVLTNLNSIKKNFKLCQEDILDYQPDVLILVDYAGFNLRMAKFAHRHNVLVYYYISPKIWAWNQKRVKKIKATVDRMFTILPFETKFFEEHGVEVQYSGNPVLDAIANRDNKDESFEDFVARNQLDNRPKVALLAGSRKGEISYNLPDMLEMVDKFPEFQFVIAGAPSFAVEEYQPFIKDKDVAVVSGQTYQLLQQARAALVTSGTATLETALLNCPQVVCYKMWGGGFTDFVAKKILIKVPYISLVNLILDKEAVLELFQKDFSLNKLERELDLLLQDSPRRNEMLADYDELHRRMGGPGSSARTASLMLEALKKDQMHA
ncbi:lipid-A-disaccharide synthase [Carboxylicivirga sediminis]|uniref:Lipid-A-disaccharide synthase n=1 Tax=Carboxylicivirga sediminis TaxID=2006564 RepID=A0A941F1U4_9BACT|nr:lipid-A-disaccharide synthase [Carboxylicivirga sediminis]MBR8535248.1 lipid-A-disaccharide synthase [Carboxylicivirga sediminis]